MKKVEGTKPEYVKHARRYGKRRANKGARHYAKRTLEGKL